MLFEKKRFASIVFGSLLVLVTPLASWGQTSVVPAPKSSVAPQEHPTLMVVPARLSVQASKNRKQSTKFPVIPELVARAVEDALQSAAAEKSYRVLPLQDLLQLQKEQQTKEGGTFSYFNNQTPAWNAMRVLSGPSKPNWLFVVEVGGKTERVQSNRARRNSTATHYFLAVALYNTATPERPIDTFALDLQDQQAYVKTEKIRRKTIRFLTLQNLSQSENNIVAAMLQKMAERMTPPPPSKPEEVPVVAPEPPAPVAVASLPVPKPPAPVARAAGVAQEHDEERPLDRLLPPPVLKVVRLPQRPGFDVRIAYQYLARQVQTNGELFFPKPGESSTDRFGAHAMAIQGALYPFAFWQNAPAQLAGLGIRGDYSKSFWKDLSYTSYPNDVPQTVPYQVDKWRTEGALTWLSQFSRNVWVPELEVMALYGAHQFELTPRQGPSTVPLPSTRYQYAGGTLGIRTFLSEWVEISVQATIAKTFSLGDDISSPAKFGPGDGFLWRTQAYVGLNAKGFKIGAQASYERVHLSFAGLGAARFNAAPITTMRDEQFSILAVIGCAFSPGIPVK